MRKIVPFNNVLDFSTDVCEITAISLEHNIKKEEDVISGVFLISGEYKITDGDIKKQKFNFELPFDIALSRKYKLDTLTVDIDDFRYKLVDNNKLKINIDLYVDGEEIKEEIPEEETIEPIPINIVKDIEVEKEDNLFEEMLEGREEHNKENQEIENKNENINIFSGFNEDEKYVTYRVYRVNEGDTIDNVLEKYGITREELANYNVIDEIKEGDKLIIPTNDK